MGHRALLKIGRLASQPQHSKQLLIAVLVVVRSGQQLVAGEDTVRSRKETQGLQSQCGCLWMGVWANGDMNLLGVGE